MSSDIGNNILVALVAVIGLILIGIYLLSLYRSNWKGVKNFSFDEVPDLVRFFKKANAIGVTFSENAWYMIDKLNLAYLPPHNFSLIAVTLKDLGINRPMNLKKVIEIAVEKGYKICPMEVLFYLLTRSPFTDVGFILVTKPIGVSLRDEMFNALFLLTSKYKPRSLKSTFKVNACPENAIVSSESKLVFMVSQ